VDDGVLGPRVTVGTFSGSANQLCTWLFGFRSRTSAIEQKGGDDHREGDGDSDKDVTKGHGFLRRYGGATSPPNEGDFKSRGLFCEIRCD
jgi:hypothetical protein